MQTRNQRLLAGGLLSLLLLGGCAGTADTVQETAELADEAVALTEAPQSTLRLPSASGTQVQRSASAAIDYSHVTDGYVMVQYTAATSKKLKVQVKGPTTTYTYHLQADGAWDVYPLSDGNGAYQVTVYQNVSGMKYAAVLSQSFSVTLADEFVPFLYPNQYVDYGNAPKTVAKAAELTAGKTDTLEIVQAVYEFAVRNLTYDKQLASSVQSGYVPDLDAVLTKKTGICFDYAALVTGMLRSVGVPCKLVVGYAGTAYHAWISVWSAEAGWIEGVVYFDGTSWQRMDPTFASAGNERASIMQYINDGTNYTAKYYY